MLLSDFGRVSKRKECVGRPIFRKLFLGMYIVVDTSGTSSLGNLWTNDVFVTSREVPRSFLAILGDRKSISNRFESGREAVESAIVSDRLCPFERLETVVDRRIEN